MKFRTVGRFAVGLFLGAVAALLTGCGDDAGTAASATVPTKTTRAVPVTTALAVEEEIVVELQSVGRAVSRNSPTLAAEVDARVTAVHVETGQTVVRDELLVQLDTTALELSRREATAEIRQIEASIGNERHRVARYRNLRGRGMVPVETLDDAEAQLAVEEASREAARARVAIIDDRLKKTQVRAPMDGVIESRFVSVGDFVKIGEDLVKVTDTQHLRAQLPFPETVADRLAVGQRVVLESPLTPGTDATAEISEIKPEVGALSRAVVAMVLLENPGGWRADATVQARVVVDRRSRAVVVPAQAVVARPAGQVVYVLEGDIARERVVEVGQLLEGRAEILTGVTAGERVVVEGAGALTNGTAVATTADAS